jgi:anti-sigma factor RsiW
MEHLTRYLFGEFSEDERAALEERYISDPRLFDEVVRAESDLLDDYVRGTLTPEIRERVERVYLTHPQRRERLKFAEALLTKLERTEGLAASAE